MNDCRASYRCTDDNDRDNDNNDDDDHDANDKDVVVDDDDDNNNDGDNNDVDDDHNYEDDNDDDDSDAVNVISSGTPEPWGQGGQLPPLPFWQGGQGGQQCPSSENLKNLTSFIKIIYTKTSPRSRTHIEPMLPQCPNNEVCRANIKPTLSIYSGDSDIEPKIPTSNKHRQCTVDFQCMS